MSVLLFELIANLFVCAADIFYVWLCNLECCCNYQLKFLLFLVN